MFQHSGYSKIQHYTEKCPGHKIFTESAALEKELLTVQKSRNAIITPWKLGNLMAVTCCGTSGIY